MSQLIFPKSQSTKSHTTTRKSFNSKPLFSVLLQLSFILISVFMVYNVVKSISLTNQKLQILTQAEKEVQDLRLENISLYLEKNSTNTDDYIEAEARNKLYYSRPGETQYVIPETLLRRYINSSAAPIVSGEVKGKSTVESWADFFLKGI